MNKYLEKSRNGMVLTKEALERVAYSSLTTSEGLAFMIGKKIVGVEGILNNIFEDECVGIILTLQDITGELSVLSVGENECIEPGRIFFDEVIIREDKQP